jgi:hypothetical protein
LHFHVKAATGKQNGGQNNDKSASLMKMKRKRKKKILNKEKLLPSQQVFKF